MASLFIHDSAVYRLYFTFTRIRQYSCVSYGQRTSRLHTLRTARSHTLRRRMWHANRFAPARLLSRSRPTTNRILQPKRSLPSKRLIPTPYLHTPLPSFPAHTRANPALSSPNHYPPPAYTPPPSPSSPPPSSANSACSFQHQP